MLMDVSGHYIGSDFASVLRMTSDGVGWFYN